ncbi:MAG TPA: hypothetical protein VJT13_14425 [Xanthobacteraceae bacterium]|nr:hypothetical protein [Xanthobacteraceae bacterium]
MSHLIEPDVPEDLIKWIDEQVAAGRFYSREDADFRLLKPGLEEPDSHEENSS